MSSLSHQEEEGVFGMETATELETSVQLDISRLCDERKESF